MVWGIRGLGWWWCGFFSGGLPWFGCERAKEEKYLPHFVPTLLPLVFTVVGVFVCSGLLA